MFLQFPLRWRWYVKISYERWKNHQIVDRIETYDLLGPVPLRDSQFDHNVETLGWFYVYLEYVREYIPLYTSKSCNNLCSKISDDIN
jgi:hypothetical protein